MTVGDTEGGANAGILTVPEVATYLRLPVSTVYRLVERGDLPGHKVGRQWRFHRAVLTEWFRARACSQQAIILVVDDDPMIRELIVAALQADARQIHSAASGEAALHISQTTALDLVLLDLLLPGLTGVETFRQLHARRPDLPVVIVTGHPDSDLMGRALEIGPFTVLSKPIDIPQLQQVVDLILGR